MTAAEGDAMTTVPAETEPGRGRDRLRRHRATRPRGARLGFTGWLRWTWRQLTSMRTALILLFLLALASVPGSVLPQEGVDPAQVSQYYATHPGLAPILNKLSLFSVFAAPWFAAIYLLLFASLAGCVLPRTFRLVGQARQKPPRAPSNLSRLPMSMSYATAASPAIALDSAASLLGGRRFRLQRGDGWVSAEKGYLREVGNLLFHVALLALLFSVGMGGVFGYKANRLLVVGQGFANTPTALDVFRPGRLVSPGDLQPFSINLRSFKASYVTSGPQLDQPISYDAALNYQTKPGAKSRQYMLRVNHPLVVDNVSVYLIGHGYAPEFKITDGAGQVQFDGPVPFIPVNQTSLLSEGVIKVPDAEPDQLGFAGVFLPSADDIGGRLTSVFPAPVNPQVSLVAFKGNLGMNSGQAQSVYTLNTQNLQQVAISTRPLAPGQSMVLPDHDGTITYTGYQQWVSLAITYDPGQLPALISAIAALAGIILSFLIRRRRVFLRAEPAADGGTRVVVGGLARSDAAGGFESEFAELAELLRVSHDGAALAGPAVAGDSADKQADAQEEERGRVAIPAGLPVTADMAPVIDDRQDAALAGREGE